MRMRVTIAAVACICAAACGSREPGQTHRVKIDVGGSVAYDDFPVEPLGGALVTLTDVDGQTRTATTSSGGLWTIEDVVPGPYVETYEKDGYEPLERRFVLQAFGESDIANVFESRGVAFLEEVRARATVTVPFVVEVMNQEYPTDGQGGVSAVYRPSMHGDIVVTTNRRITAGGVYFFEPEGSDFVLAIQEDTANGSTFTIRAADLDAINGGAGPEADSDLLTFSQVQIVNLRSYTPIHGEQEILFSRIQINVEP